MSAPMTFKEFRHWLEGFEEAFSGTYLTGHPSKEQWEKIKAKLALVEAQPAKGPVFRGLDLAAGPDRAIIHTYGGGQIISPGSNEPKEQDQ